MSPRMPPEMLARLNPVMRVAPAALTPPRPVPTNCRACGANNFWERMPCRRPNRLLLRCRQCGARLLWHFHQAAA